MTGFTTVLLLAALPAAGNFVGGLAAEALDISGRVLSIALHLALGIILAVVSLELLPQAFEADAKWVVILAFGLGGVFFTVADRAIHVVERRLGGARSGALAVYFATSVDLMTDGLMIGTGAVISSTLALLLALGQVTADIPEGFATIAGLKSSGVPRRRRVLLNAALAIPVFAGAAIGYYGVRDAPQLVQLSLLAFSAGVLTSVAVEEIGPQAERCEPRNAALALVGGFTLFAFISAYVEV